MGVFNEQSYGAHSGKGLQGAPGVGFNLRDAPLEM